MPGLGQRQRKLNGLEVAHLADEENVGVLPEGRAQRPLERRAVDADLALVDGGELVVVHVLDRILDREDVERPSLVDASDDGGQSRRFSRTRSDRSAGRGPGGVGPAIRRSGGSPSSSKLGMSEGIIRSASAISPLWWKALPAAWPCRARSERSRRPGAPRGWPPARGSACLDELVDLRPRERRRILEGRRPPSTLTRGGEPLTSSRSEPCWSQSTWSQGSIRSL